MYRDFSFICEIGLCGHGGYIYYRFHIYFYFQDGFSLTDVASILNFLRDGNIPLPESKRELLEIQIEAKYYLVQELVDLIETQLKRKEELEPICRVPLITSQKEEQILISSTAKVYCYKCVFSV